MSEQSDKALILEREAKREYLAAAEDRLSGDMDTAEFHYAMAEKLKLGASDLLAVTGELTLAGSGEVVQERLIRNTLAEPNTVNVAASADRVARIDEGGVLALGLDAAQSIDASNSLEKMLAHQMALCHDQSFRLITQANELRDNLEKVRMLNAAARFMKAYQDGFLCLNRIRTGGKQTVVVQHVNVSDGGQAVVAGKVGGCAAKGGEEKNGR
jgi:hypothetical protein